MRLGEDEPHVAAFAVDGDTIYTAVDQQPNPARSRQESAGHRASRSLTDDWEELWWVRADGRAEVLTEQRQMATPLRLLATRYWQYRQTPAN